jgi:hypothetical protein
VLEEIVSRGDVNGFELFKHRVANHGNAPQAGQASTSGVNNAANGISRPAAMGPRGLASGTVPARRKFFAQTAMKLEAS